jgi:hypothetical protein
MIVLHMHHDGVPACVNHPRVRVVSLTSGLSVPHNDRQINSIVDHGCSLFFIFLLLFNVRINFSSSLSYRTFYTATHSGDMRTSSAIFMQRRQTHNCRSAVVAGIEGISVSTI